MHPVSLQGLSSAGGTLLINNSGQVVGSAYSNGIQGYLMTAANGQGATFIPGQLQPMAINSAGQLAGIDFVSVNTVNDQGNFVYGVQSAFLTGPNGTGITHLGALNLGTYSIANGMNDQGVVVGTSTTNNGLGLDAFVYGLNGEGIQDINSFVTLEGGATLYQAIAINNNNQIVADGTDGHVYFLSMVPEPDSLCLLVVGLGAISYLAASRGKVKPGFG